MQLAVEERGHGPAVVLLHGAPSPSADFDRVAAALAHKHRVFTVDLPGYGKSARLTPYSLTAVAELLEAMLAQRDVNDAAFVGFSGGGYLALTIATRGVVKAKAIVTIGAFAGLTADERGALMSFVPLLRSLETVTDPGLRQVFTQRMLSEAFITANPDRARAVADWLNLVHPHVLADELEAAANGPDLHEAIGKLTVPITAIVGALDVATPKAQSEKLVAAAANGRLVVVADRGHALLVEDPERATGEITAALGRA